MSKGGWADFFKKRREERRKLAPQNAHEIGYHELNSTLIDMDPYVQMCEHCDYVMFYIGHTGGDLPPGLPRYEYMTSYRGLAPEEAAKRADATVERMAQAIAKVKLSEDREHNYLSRTILVKLVPSVLQRAHELSKTVGRKLQSELRSTVITRLSEIGTCPRHLWKV